MFEKEAEGYVNREYDNSYYPDCNFSARQDAKTAFKDGAEFGYNKANKWHYVKDEDLPKDEDWKWCVSYRGYYYVAKYEEMFGCWTNQEYSEVMQPYAWKEIVLPKESEENER
jgi:hypothetical protein